MLITLIGLISFAYSCNQEQNSTLEKTNQIEIEKQSKFFIKTGTEFEKTDNILKKYGAKKNVFSRKFTNSSMSYLLPNNVGIIVIYESQEGGNIIIELLQCNKPEVAKDVRVWENVDMIELTFKK